MSTRDDVIKALKKDYIVPRRKVNSIIDFLMMTTEEVLAKFLTLPNAVRVGTGDKSWVYIPPTRKDSVLLVAHSDTVWEDKRLEIGLSNNVLFSLTGDTGIGADDRAGCFILWQMAKTGHALLIPNAEESGCVGSRALIAKKDWQDIIRSHRFALEFDRMNEFDIVTYEVGDNKFEKWLEKNMRTKSGGFKKARGTFTDICVLLNQDNHPDELRSKVIPGANISVGYYGQHSTGELLVLPQLQRTIQVSHKLLMQKDLPQFYQPETTKTKSYSSYSGYGHGYSDYSEYESYGSFNNSNNSEVSTRRVKDKSIQAPNVEDIISIAEDFCACPECSLILDIDEVRFNSNKCTSCDKKVLE